MSGAENDNSNQQVAVALPAIAGGAHQSHVDATIISAVEFVRHPPVSTIMWGLDLFTKAVIVLIIAIAIGALTLGPMTTAKILVAGIFASLALGAIAVIILRPWLIELMREIEDIGYFFDEITRHDAQQARIALEMLNERLNSQLHPVEAAVIPELLKNFAPLVRMLMKKEKSTLSWLMLGAKVAKNAFDMFNQRKPS
ncbi:MAG TPA: hypothetical protein V6C69_05460 [Trichormus sp.]|jgi:hypothetical protein